PQMRGRVSALYVMIFLGGTPFGAPFIGWIGEAFGARWTLILGGLLSVAGIAVSAALFARARGMLPRPTFGRPPALRVSRAPERTPERAPEVTPERTPEPVPQRTDEQPVSPVSL